MEKTGSTGVFQSSNPSNYPHENHEVWFKAATIAVPICGAMILLMLVVLAFKILRADHVTVHKLCQDSNALTELNQYTHDSAKKVPLLYDSRQNCQEFRSITTTRIHYGQNVNILKEVSQKPEKNVNVEYARVHGEGRSRQEEEEDGVEVEITEGDTRELSHLRINQSSTPQSFVLNLEKLENVNVCNVYYSPRQTDLGITDKCSKYS